MRISDLVPTWLVNRVVFPSAFVICTGSQGFGSGSAFLESLDPDPDLHLLESLDLDPDPHFDPDQKFFFCFLT